MTITHKNILVRSFIAALLLGAAIVPALSFAATYAYVNTAGEVRTVESASPNAAISSAPGIHMHSGVMLLDSQSDNDVVGDDVDVR